MKQPPKIALVMESARQYERGIIRGIARYSELHGPWQFHRNIPLVSGGSGTTPAALRRWGADGLIIRQSRDIRGFLALSLPTVVSPFKDYFPGYPNVLTDDRAVGRLGARHLIDRGFRRFAYCGMDRMFFWSADRGAGFCTAVADAGLAVSRYAPPLKSRTFVWSREQRHMLAWLASLATPVGLMVCNDDFCLCVIEACRIAGYRIPDDVAIVSVGNDEMVCELTFPPLTSISLNTGRGGYEAAANLDAQLAGKTPGADITIEPLRVVARQSSDVLAVDDPEVAAAVRFIRTNAARAIQVADVVDATAVSRRELYDRFSRALGRSIYGYMQAVRTARVAKLLIETTLPVSRIAAACDFPDEKNFARFFRTQKGTSPLKYRRRHGVMY